MRRRKRRFLFSTGCTLLIITAGLVGALLFFKMESLKRASEKKPDEIFLAYVGLCLTGSGKDLLQAHRLNP